MSILPGDEVRLDLAQGEMQAWRAGVLVRRRKLISAAKPKWLARLLWSTGLSGLAVLLLLAIVITT